MLKWIQGNGLRLLRISTLILPVMFLTAHAQVVAATQILSEQRVPLPPGNHARSAALIDVASGRILFSQRGEEQMKIASLTKIMTAIVAIEHGKLDSLVKVSSKAAGKEGSSLYLKAGEKMTLSNVLYGLMLRSGNDAAVAIAEHIGGSLEGFAYLMNKKAEEIGLTNSQFKNPHGLDQEGHYSSANDLAKLTAYALHNDTFSKIVATKVKSAPNPFETWDYKWVNKNKMLTMYDGADGVKTGYTKQALRCLVSSATRNGQQLAVVTLNDGNDWLDHRNLLDYGFKHYPLEKVTKPGDPVAGYPYQVLTEFQYPFAAGEREKLVIKLSHLNEESVYYKLGYRGQLRFILEDQLIGSVPLAPVDILERSKPTSHSSLYGPAAAKPVVSEASANLSLRSSIRISLRALFLQGGNP